MSKKSNTNRPPARRTNAEMRDQEYLTEKQVQQLLAAAKKYGKANADRDELLISLMYTHGLRVSEVVAIKWEHLSYKEMMYYVKRSKHGVNTPHPIPKEEYKLLRKYQRKWGHPPVSG